MYPDTLFYLFGQEINLYNIMLVLGVVLCVVFVYLMTRREKFSYTMSYLIIAIGFIAIICGLLSATLFQSIYNYIQDPSQGFVFEGMTFIGGLLGGSIFYIGLYCIYTYLINPKLKDTNRFKNKKDKTLFDALKFIPIGITLAHAVGRIGCFFEGCCYGKPTNAWYGIKFATTSEKVIPTQLFESIFLFLLTGVMLFLYLKFEFAYCFGVYGISYGIYRFISEFYRGDDRGTFIGNISPSQFWCIFFVLGGIAFILVYRLLRIQRGKIVKKEVQEKTTI